MNQELRDFQSKERTVKTDKFPIESFFSFERYYGYDFFNILYKDKEYILGIFRRHDGRGLSVRIKRYQPNGSTPISLTLIDRMKYVRPLRKVGYVLDIKEGTINGSAVSDEDKGNKELNAKVRFLCTFKKFEEL